MKFFKHFWITSVQNEIFQQKPFSQLEHSISLFRDCASDFRCEGRLRNASVPYEIKYPVLLTPDSQNIIHECFLCKRYEKKTLKSSKSTKFTYM